MKTYPLYCLILTSLFGFALPAFAKEYYVDPSGNNVDSGSANSPWKTIQHAANQASAGDLILVAPGDYSEMVTVKNSGRESAPIHFKSQEPHAAKLQGFVLKGDYITVEGFKITNDRGNGSGIHAGEAHRKDARKGCQMLDNYLHDLSGTAIYTGINGVVRGNVMKNVGRGVFANSGTVVESNEIDTLVPTFQTKNGKERPKKTQYCFFVGEDIIFRNNYLHGTEEKYLIEGMGVCFFTTYDAWIFGPSKNILIEGNRCFNATHASEPSGTALKESENFIYRNNLFVNTVYVGILCQKVKQIIIENNTFINCGAYPVWFQSKRETQGSIVRNNIIAYIDRDRAVEEFGWKPGDAGIRNNLHPGDPVTTSNNLIWKTQNRAYSDTDFSADPLFVDPANHDYRLRPNSPAVNAGATLSEVQTDLRGVERPQGGQYDIGAYEYTPNQDAQ